MAILGSGTKVFSCYLLLGMSYCVRPGSIKNFQSIRQNCRKLQAFLFLEHLLLLLAASSESKFIFSINSFLGRGESINIKHTSYLHCHWPVDLILLRLLSHQLNRKHISTNGAGSDGCHGGGVGSYRKIFQNCYTLPLKLSIFVNQPVPIWDNLGPQVTHKHKRWIIKG